MGNKKAKSKKRAILLIAAFFMALVLIGFFLWGLEGMFQLAIYTIFGVILGALIFGVKYLIKKR